jgi:hypothetical protein
MLKFKAQVLTNNKFIASFVTNEMMALQFWLILYYRVADPSQNPHGSALF